MLHQPLCPLPPPSSINPHILLHMPPQPVDIVFMSISNGPQHSTFIISPLYTPSFIIIMYKSYNVNTIQIAIKNNHHNSPPIIHTSQTYHLFPYFSNNIFLFSYNHCTFKKSKANTNNYCNVLSLYSLCMYYHGSLWYIRNISTDYNQYKLLL